jgi:hypothetical protein
MSQELVELARRLVEIDREAGDIRNAMRSILANGADAPVRPTIAQRSGGKKPPAGKHAEALAQAARAEQEIVAILRSGPMRMAEVAAQMAAKQSTTSERFRRLEGRGLIQRNGIVWSAVETAAD